MGFNSSGLITRGLGKAQKLVTRGFGFASKIIKDFPPKVDVQKEYIIEILSPVFKEVLLEINIVVPIKKVIDKQYNIKSNVNKESLKEFILFTKTDSKALFNILDAI